MIRKPCSECGVDMGIWHATIYRTFDPAELTPEKEQELKEWIDNVYRPKMDEIWASIGQTGTEPNTCPHCGAKLLYENWPVKEVKPWKPPT